MSSEAGYSSSVAAERPVARADDDVAIRVTNLSKCYHIYDRPQDRLKQSIVPRLQRLIGRPPTTYAREFWALKDVSFEVKKGETVGIIGRNGSGKSTLLQMICGTLTPTSGRIQINGRVSALLELGAGFNPEFTGRENVLLNAAILGIEQEEIEARFMEIVSFSELGDFIDQPVKTYSSGMHVRLAFSIAIHVDPQVFIVDEALAVGDARFQAKCMKRINEIQKSGATILFVSHDVGSVRTLCSRAYWLDNGLTRMGGDVFPVTGHYMEFLFADEAPTELRHAAQLTEDDRAEIDHRPVTHWGSHLGTIRSAGIYSLDGKRIDVVKWNEEVEVRLLFVPPPDVDHTHLSAAFSIKDLKGTDLIVSTTHDWKRLQFGNLDGVVSVRYRFKNPLVTGKYLLVAAIEDRSSTVAHYYEYLEGAHYFSSLANEALFGIFQPEITQSLTNTAT